MQSRWGVKPDQTIIYGQSVGSAPTVHLAAKHKVAGVVIHSGFMSALRVRSSHPTPIAKTSQFIAKRTNLSSWHRWFVRTEWTGASNRVTHATGAVTFWSIFLTAQKSVRQKA